MRNVTNDGDGACDAPVTDDAERLDALGRVLGGGTVSPDTNGARILEYLVHEVIEGREDEIRATGIARDVLGRDASFDPSRDSAVRVEMKRLRDALDHHYATVGAEDPVRIEIPKGRYIACFVRHDPRESAPGGRSRRKTTETRGETAFIESPQPEAAPASPRAGRWPWVAALAALALGAAGLAALVIMRPDGGPAEGDGELAVRIEAGAPQVDERLDDYFVARDTLAAFRNVRMMADQTMPSDYAIRLTPLGSRLNAVAIHLASGEIAASETFEGDEIGRHALAYDPTPFRAWIGRLAQRNGVLERDHTARGEAVGNLRCSNLTEAYLLDRTDAGHAAAMNCVERQRAREQDTARLWIDYAILTREEYTDGRNPRDGDPLVRAVAAAREAVRRDAFDALAHYALMTVLVLADQPEAAVAAGERAMRLNPYDAAIVRGYADRLNALGRHQRALQLLALAEGLSPDRSGSQEYNIFLARFASGFTTNAARSAMDLRGRRDPLSLAAVAIGHAILGDGAAAASAKAELLAQQSDPRALFERRSYETALTDRLVSALDAIG